MNTDPTRSTPSAPARSATDEGPHDLVGIALGGREPAVSNLDAAVDTSPRGQLLRFLDRRVFEPLERDAPGPVSGGAGAAPDGLARLRTHLHEPGRTAHEIADDFFDAVAAADRAPAGVPEALRELPHLAGVLREFLQLRDGLGV